MELHILENGLNSLEVGINFFDKFIYDNTDKIDISVGHYGDLKFAVIAIHNAVELLTKEILKDINEFLIFELDVEGDDTLCEMLYRQYKKQKKTAHISYWSVFTEGRYKTIEYNRCIKIICKIFKDYLTDENKGVLLKLADYRNALTHLGYASTFDWYKILINLEQVLRIVYEFYFVNIKTNVRDIEDIKVKIEKLLQKSYKNTYEVWFASNSLFLCKCEDYLDKLFEESKLQISEDSTTIDCDDGELYETLIIEKNNKYNIKFKYSYINGAIFLLNDYDNIIFAITLEDFNFNLNEVEELEKVYVSAPKKIMNYNKNTQYKLYKLNKALVKSSEEFNVYQLNLGNLQTLLNKYLFNK